MILLNRAIQAKGIYEVSSGGITEMPIDIRMLFAVLLKTVFTSVILAHNHPSGTLRPSESDKRLTSRISEAGDLLVKTVLDHVIPLWVGSMSVFLDEGTIRKSMGCPIFVGGTPYFKKETGSNINIYLGILIYKY